MDYEALAESKGPVADLSAPLPTLPAGLALS